MTRVYAEDKAIPVSVVDQESCVISLVGKDGYEIGLGKKKNPNKALTGKYKDLGYVPRYRYWVTAESLDESMKIGNKVEVVLEGEEMLDINVKGVTKGKGFAGVVKRHGFAGGKRTHGQSDRQRAPGFYWRWY